jgi:uncharacterized Zn finger protein (UPF0148 family)
MGLKDDLSKQVEESYKTRDTGNRSFIYINDKFPIFFPAKGKTYIIDVLPWRIGTAKNIPFNLKDKYLPGNYAYVLDLMVHTKIPPSRASIICLSSYNKKCPICEKWEEYKNSEEYDAKNDPFKPRRRVVYAVIVRTIDDEEVKKEEIRIFEASHFYTEKIWAELARNSKRGKGYQIFADFDIEEGRSISFKVENAQNKAIVASQFLTRTEPISDIIQKQCEHLHLDDNLIVLDYDTVAEYLLIEAAADNEDDFDVPFEFDEKAVENIRNPSTPEVDKSKVNMSETIPEPLNIPMAETSEKQINNEVLPGCFGLSHDSIPKCEECEPRIWKLCLKEFAKKGN